jgi:hypothetical protein
MNQIRSRDAAVPGGQEASMPTRIGSAGRLDFFRPAQSTLNSTGLANAGTSYVLPCLIRPPPVEQLRRRPSRSATALRNVLVSMATLTPKAHWRAWDKRRGKKQHPQTRGDQQMSSTLRLTHKTIGVEVRRGTYDAVVDGMLAGSVDLDETTDIPVEPGRHTLQVRSGRDSSRTKTFDVGDDEDASFRCSGKSILPIFLLSFVVPGLALSLHRE